MVRSVADRAFLPAKSLFEQVGNMMILTGKTLTATVKPPYPYGGDFIGQFLFARAHFAGSPVVLGTRRRELRLPGRAIELQPLEAVVGARERLAGVSTFPGDPV